MEERSLSDELRERADEGMESDDDSTLLRVAAFEIERCREALMDIAEGRGVTDDELFAPDFALGAWLQRRAREVLSPHPELPNVKGGTV